ncbi:ubiquinol oxidase subunit II [Paraglaciecola psychrophila 170]|uniref:Ubiquinol oxidase subunit 2 n=1 Tax=Paraglaciecola psychrophila 170 TaxID=1129794 RepID=K6ZQG2_9ALTE|nr:ubiquinol oxidase subunit II [Paraglaciecola psychrophila]AGH45523.1 ubiquinol oxidase subunit II [Paraglaciecola psychrophila 170]GAC38186.1 cytochrome o ubiquinol oxidase subunit II [Paraglaciecola psychrophila 170]
MLISNLSKAATAASFMVLTGCEGGVLDPKGQVGIDEKQLIIVATLLMLIVVLPVIFMTLYFAWKYREGRDHEIYTPKWAHSNKIETVVWAVPIIIIIILGVITWKSTHDLDPYTPLEHERDHINVEVVSLDWKWLFIYPDYGVASVNELAFPANVPVAFKITSDTAMNSFFIPQLGSQIYSMAGMQTKLHLIANEPGTFDGISANYSGEGFAGMKFKAIATNTDEDFAGWIAKLKKQGQSLNPDSYKLLAEPSENNSVEYYGSVSDGMFKHVLMQYMHKEMGMEHQHQSGHSAPQHGAME